MQHLSHKPIEKVKEYKIKIKISQLVLSLKALHTSHTWHEYEVSYLHEKAKAGNIMGRYIKIWEKHILELLRKL